MKRLLIYLCLSFVLAHLAKSAYAVEGLVAPSREEKVLPGDITYPVKRLFEKIKLSILFPKKVKVKYQTKLLEKRLSELYSITSKKRLNQIERSAQRYAAQAGSGISLNEDALQKHKTILSNLRDAFPANSAYWLSIQQDIDTLEILFK